MNKISRKGFIKIAAAAAMSGVTAGALAACNSASGSASTSGAAGQYIPGTYEGTAEGISSTVKVTMTFSDSAVGEGHSDLDGGGNTLGSALVGAGDVLTGSTGSGGRTGSGIAGSQSTGGHTAHGGGSGDLDKALTGNLVHRYALFLFVLLCVPSYRAAK